MIDGARCKFTILTNKSCLPRQGETSFLLLLQIELPTKKKFNIENLIKIIQKKYRNSGDFGNKCSTIHNTAKITETIKNK